MIKILKDCFFPFCTKQEGAIFFKNVILMSCILINVNIVRIIKDSYVTTMLGAEAISLCKLLGELPFSVLFFFVYSKLSNIMNTERLCRCTMLTFLTILIILPFLFFQFNHLVTLQEATKITIGKNSPSLKWLVFTFGNWPYVTYFVLAEMWPIIAYSVLFWQFMNKFNNPSESAKQYISYNLYGQTSMILSGIIVNFFIKNQTFLTVIVKKILSPVHESDLKIKVLTLIVFILGITAILLHLKCEEYYKNRKLLNLGKKGKNADDKFNFTIIEGFRSLIGSSQIRNIIFIVFGYGFTVTLMHLTWLSALQYRYPSPIEFMKFQAYLNYWTGILTILIAIFGRKIVDIFGISFAAKFTPIVTLVPGIIFYIACSSYNYSMNTTMILYAVLIGSVQYVFVRASKYVLFDSTKERLYTLIKSEEIKTKGKVLADMLSFKFGKALASFTLAAPLIISPKQSYVTIAPFTGIALALVCYLWLKGVSDATKEEEEANKILDFIKAEETNKASSDSIKKAEETNKASSDSIKKTEETNKQSNSK
jgi:AAA family ATP:ADP antiporter